VLDEGVIRRVLDTEKAGENSDTAVSRTATSAQVTSAGNAASAGTPSVETTLEAATQSAEMLIGELRYLRRFLEEVDAIEDELD
jgi:hypothetical protein